MENSLVEIASRLKYLRKEAGLTQNDLSKILRIGQSTIVGYEKAEREPTLTNLARYANYFDVSIDYLSARTDEFGSVVMPGSTPVLSQEETQLLDDYRALTPALKKMILETIRTFKQAETASSSHKIS